MRCILFAVILAFGLMTVAMPADAAQQGAATAPAPTKDRQDPDLAAISRSIAEQASRLKDDAAGRDQRFQELEGALKQNLQNADAAEKNVDEIVVLLRGAAERLAPDAEFRTVFTGAEAAIRNYASQAEANLDPEIRKTADYFQQKTIEIAGMRRAAEDTRTRLSAHIDRLVTIRDRLKFSRAVAQADEFAKGAQVYLDEVRTLAATAQRLASSLDNFRGAGQTQ